MSFFRFWQALLVGILCTFGVSLSPGQGVEAAGFRAETVAEGLANPWGIVMLPDGRLLITERTGALRVVADGQLDPRPVENTPEVWANGQGGLMDIELHPQFEENGWIYLAYSKPVGEGALTSVVRGRLKDHRWVDQETIFDPPAAEAGKGRVHFGCRVRFDREGFLYFSIGDRGDKLTAENAAQNIRSVRGKIHRLHDDGRIPADNPFLQTEGAPPSVWSWGHRNPQGLAFQPGSDLLWETEHGPKGGDELNIVRKGLNYGWPLVSFGINYNGNVFTEKTEAPGLESPVIHWTPSIAVCGIDFYRGEKFPAWKGNLFATALARKHLVRVSIEGEKVTGQEMLLVDTGRIRDVRCLPDGLVYVVYDNPGKVIRLVPGP